MKTSPRRPLILKRRRLPLPVQNAPGKTSEEESKRPLAQQGPSQVQASKEVAESNSCKFPAGIKIINHPTMPNTQVVAIPNNANIQNIITALTAKGKESGSNGPNKFILISCGGAPTHPPGPQPQVQTSNDPKRTEVLPLPLAPFPGSLSCLLPFFLYALFLSFVPAPPLPPRAFLPNLCAPHSVSPCRVSPYRPPEGACFKQDRPGPTAEPQTPAAPVQGPQGPAGTAAGPRRRRRPGSSPHSPSCLSEPCLGQAGRRAGGRVVRRAGACLQKSRL